MSGRAAPKDPVGMGATSRCVGLRAARPTASTPFPALRVALLRPSLLMTPCCVNGHGRQCQGRCSNSSPSPVFIRLQEAVGGRFVRAVNRCRRAG